MRQGTNRGRHVQQPINRQKNDLQVVTSGRRYGCTTSKFINRHSELESLDEEPSESWQSEVKDDEIPDEPTSTTKVTPRVRQKQEAQNSLEELGVYEGVPVDQAEGQQHKYSQRTSHHRFEELEASNTRKFPQAAPMSN